MNSLGYLVLLHIITYFCLIYLLEHWYFGEDMTMYLEGSKVNLIACGG